MPTRTTTRCCAWKADGTPCPNRPRANKRLCWVHDPELAANRAEGRRRGGVVRSARAATLPVGFERLGRTPVLRHVHHAGHAGQRGAAQTAEG